MPASHALAELEMEAMPDAAEPPPPPPAATAPRPCGKRKNYIGWDEYFMSVAFLTAMRSKDPSTQVGACIVNEEKRIVGVGYNGFPTGIPDEALPWEKSSPEGFLETKYPYVCHAELNAVLNKNVESCKGATLYCTLFPCCDCAKVIIQSGIRAVVYASDKNRDQDVFKASKRLLKLAKVGMVSFVPEKRELVIPLRYPGEEDGVPLEVAGAPPPAPAGQVLQAPPGTSSAIPEAGTGDAGTAMTPGKPRRDASSDPGFSAAFLKGNGQSPQLFPPASDRPGKRDADPEVTPAGKKRRADLELGAEADVAAPAQLFK